MIVRIQISFLPDNSTPDPNALTDDRWHRPHRIIRFSLSFAVAVVGRQTSAPAVARVLRLSVIAWFILAVKNVVVLFQLSDTLIMAAAAAA